MKRREFFGGRAGAVAAGRAQPALDCGCAPLLQRAAGADAFASVGTKVKITGVKVFGVSLTPDSDRPYVFVKLETDAGVVGWGEGTLEGKAAAVMACIEDPPLIREILGHVQRREASISRFPRAPPDSQPALNLT